MNFSPFLSIHHSCDETLLWSKERLTQAGLRAMLTFDLHAARAGSHDCSCPNHGTEKCDCQMVVMLVYGKSEAPITLILHGNDGQTWLSMVDDISQKSNATTVTLIKNSLKGSLSQAEKNSP